MAEEVELRPIVENTLDPIPEDVVSDPIVNADVETATDHYLDEGLALLIDPETGRIHANVAQVQPCPLCGSNVPKPFLVRQGFPYVRCDDCSMIYMSPRLHDEIYEKRLRADEDLRDRFHASLAQNHPSRDERVLRNHLVRLKAAAPRGKLLDLNCGLGDFMILARGAGYVVSGVELHHFAATHARGNGFQVYQNQLGSFNLQPHSIDAVTALNVLGREQRPLELLHHVRTILRPRGRLLLTCPNLESLSCQLLGLESSDLINAPDQVNWFNRETLQKMISAGGFRIVEMTCLEFDDLEQLYLQCQQLETPLNPFLYRVLAQQEWEPLRRDLGQVLKRHWLGSWLLAECAPAEA